METTPAGWHVLDREGAVLWREYTFGPALVTGNDLVAMTRALVAKI